jgi:hypothetical protein
VPNPYTTSGTELAWVTLSGSTLADRNLLNARSV